MPPIALSTAETETLVAFVQSLVPDGAAEHHVQWRRTLRVPHLARLPDDGDEAAFARLDGVRLPTAPLWWRPEAVHEATLRVAHDGEQILIRVEWADATRDERAKVGASITVSPAATGISEGWVASLNGSNSRMRFSAT